MSLAPTDCCGPVGFWEGGRVCVKQWKVEHGILRWSHGRLVPVPKVTAPSARKVVNKMPAIFGGSPCCLSMSTVSATPGVCQQPCCCAGDGGAGAAQTFLNTIGKWGVSIAGIASGRATNVGGRTGVTVAPSAQQTGLAAAGKAQAWFPVILIIVAAVVLILILKK